MKHSAAPSFWEALGSLDADVQESARKAFQLLKNNSRHPGLHFKKIDNVWSVRVDIRTRALAIEQPDGFLWIWIGSHDEYERMLR